MGLDEQEQVAVERALIPVARKVMVGDREVELKPMSIGAMSRFKAELGEMLQKLMVDHPEVDLNDPGRHAGVLTPAAWDWGLKLLSDAVGVPVADIEEQLTLLEGARLVRILLEVNQIPEIRGEVNMALRLIRMPGAPVDSTTSAT